MTHTAYASGEFVAQHLQVTDQHGNDDVPLMETVDARERVQPNGVDIGFAEVERISGAADFSEDDYDKPDRTLIQANEADERCNVAYYSLVPGQYAVTYDVKFTIPSGYVGRMYPRSRLMRSGIHLTSALWDQGYEGQGEGLLEVPRSVNRVILPVTETIGQFTLIESASAEEEYDGIHQHEGLKA